MIVFVLIGIPSCLISSVFGKHIIPRENVPEIDSSANAATVEKFGIYPGTKWCGKGNIATSEIDFGKFQKTDKCCHVHDHCPNYIESYKTSYGMYNPYPWTISHCSCDDHLFQCLKNAGTETADHVGRIYFRVLQVACITLTDSVECTKYKYSLPIGCQESKTVQKAVIHANYRKWDEVKDQDSLSKETAPATN